MGKSFEDETLTSAKNREELHINGCEKEATMTTQNASLLYAMPTYGHLLVEGLQRSPEVAAFIQADQEVSRSEAADTIGRFISVLRERGLGPGDTIAVLSPNRIEAVLVLFASAVMGLRYVPLHPLGGADDHAFIVEDAEVSMLIFAPKFLERTRMLTQRVPALKQVLCLGGNDFCDDLLVLATTAVPSPLVPQASSESIGFLLYTGGTTGRPKGVLLSHRSMVTNALIQMGDWDLPRRPRFLVVTPVTHSALTWLVPVFLRGGTVVLQDGFTVQAFVEQVQRHHISMSFVVPTMLYTLLDSPDGATADLSSLEMLIYGAAPISPTRLREAGDRFGPILAQLYGQTEVPNTVTLLRREDHDPLHGERLASCGRPCAGVIVALLDSEGNEVPTGAIGELCVRGPLVMSGYWKQPEETATTLRNGWLHTSDLARRDSEGFLYLVDRAKDMIITGGFNVYPREVEDVLLTHPAVAQAAVIGTPDEKWGETVTAYIVLRADQDVDAEMLQAHVRRAKGPVHTPKHLYFVEHLPLTGLGKLDKKTLRASHWNGQERAIH